MKKLLDSAVLNNISWCGMVGETHGISHILKGNIWGMMSEAPPYYPDLITLSNHTTLKEVMDSIGERNIKSLKDSFASLHLEPYSFRVLFDAEWIFHPPCILGKKIDFNWTTITTKDELTRWNMANGTERIILPSILKKEDVKVFIHENGGRLSGFIAHVGADVVGVSNVFSAEYSDGNIWNEIVRVASTQFPDLYLVGYEREDELRNAISSGWKSLGPLKVWINTVGSE